MRDTTVSSDYFGFRFGNTYEELCQLNGSELFIRPYTVFYNSSVGTAD